MPYTAMLAIEDSIGKSQEERIQAFWKRLEETLCLVHEDLQIRHKRLVGTRVEVAPLFWRFGAVTRFHAGAVIDPALYDNYSTISVGYAGLYECVYALTGHSHSDPETRPFAIEIMNFLNDHCAKWREDENISYSLYGTPIESTTYKFAKALRARFSSLDTPEVKEILKYDYVTNSSHLNVREHISIFDKFTIEAEFQRLSPGGSIHYGECVHMEDNIPAILEVVKFMYDTILYGELNTKSDYCLDCGYDKEIPLVRNEETGKLEFVCPKCGNRNPVRMQTTRRLCGYLGSNDFNQGRKAEIADRFVHLGGELDTDTPTVVAIPTMAATC